VRVHLCSAALACALLPALAACTTTQPSVEFHEGTVRAAECVVLLHGLARTSASMNPIAAAFEARGYAVANVDYPSRTYPIEELAGMAVEAGIARCPEGAGIHFVTHSLGGILARYYLERHEVPALRRVVMLAPPNRGSEVVDLYRDVPGFEAVGGPAGLQLGTDKASIPRRLGPVDYEVGVIAGTGTLNPILSLLLPDPDDGKVSLDSTIVDGMADLVVVPHSHPFITQMHAAIEYAVLFIESGRFVHDEP
jgi:pimeloyl-ACP methyl ester carboxylesterase